MNVISTLNYELMTQSFPDEDNYTQIREIAQMMYSYSKLENSIAIISDFNSNKSYVYYGGIADILGVEHHEGENIVNSIWVDKVLKKIHPDDLLEKHLLELQYIRHLKELPQEERSKYYMGIYLRMLDKSNNYISIYHRIYSYSFQPENLSIALCFYNRSVSNYISQGTEGVIINSASGEVTKSDKQRCTKLLTRREKEVLSLIEQGKMSKEISEALSISKNTVDRHRQNILEKLRVKNSLEACRIAKKAGLL